MGRPYTHDVAALPQTFEWAMSLKIPVLVRAIASAVEFPTVYIGSGGSYTSAVFGAQLHTLLTAKLSRAVTPFEARAISKWRDLGAMVLSGGGNNPDVVGTFKYLVTEEPAVLGIICSRLGSKLSAKVQRFAHVEMTEAEPPIGKDGFLATNSLLSACVLLYRAYCEVFGRTEGLPNAYEDFVPATAMKTDAESVAVLQSSSLLVLYGPTSTAVAVDLESKVNEAGLGDIQITDYRNFAHGRHTGLAAKARDCSVLAFVAHEDERIATQTLELIPRSIPRLTIRLPFRGPKGAISAVAAGLHLVGARAKLLGVDPGKPQVPQFGRALYHLNAWPRTVARSNRLLAAAARKRAVSIAQNVSTDDWSRQGIEFVRRLQETALDGVVLDYDGTLCDARYRFESLPRTTAQALERLLRSGAIVGIATGRGKSVREALRQSVDRRYWSRLIIGYYNCSQIASTDDDAMPDGSERVCLALREALQRLNRHSDVTMFAKVEGRGEQLTIRPKLLGDAGRVKALTVDLLAPELRRGVTVVHSTHSIDVLAPGISKVLLLNYLERTAGRDLKLLRIGDLGQWPGNDFELLASPLGISCYRISAHPQECWNLAPLGVRFSQATLLYLKMLRPNRGVPGTFKFDLGSDI